MIWFVFIYITEKKFGSASGKIIKQKQSVLQDMLRINTKKTVQWLLVQLSSDLHKTKGAPIKVME